ncbi:histidine phosphatase family protein [Acaryochloris marina]|uniref:Phosphoglycerate mutase, putative n=1 Tax=Acaryochloris marina (strain MBIC 11017) TaxID=329726 RepID=B0CF86_ACAM1|nr:histidine phosphatase family protein [Acaryochloris marina]ABW25773.1 phosphoglycerate mutase, putative [Acaryochloris marina MBIC11017]BDM80640.1 phosphoglycerate mutase [Acaryochloris marina MBIC10699]
MAEVVWIARHGHRQDYADLGWRKRAERPHDPGLSAAGVVEAQDLAQCLKSESIEHIVASPFLRTVVTAAHTATALALPIQLEAGLGEHMSSKLFKHRPEPLPVDEMADRFPQVDRLYQSQIIPPFPETEEEALARAGKALQQLLDTFSGPLLIVTHELIGKGAVWGLVNQRPPVRFPTCSLTKLVHEQGEWKMAFTGKTSHLSQPRHPIPEIWNYLLRQIVHR